MATWVTPSFESQVLNICKSEVVVPKVRISLLTLPEGAVSRIQETDGLLMRVQSGTTGIHDRKSHCGLLSLSAILCFGRSRSGGERRVETESFLHVLAGEPVVTLSSAGPRDQLEHGLGRTKSQRSLLTATFPYSNPFSSFSLTPRCHRA